MGPLKMTFMIICDEKKNKKHILFLKSLAQVLPKTVVNGSMAQLPKGGFFVRGHDKPIHGSCAIDPFQVVYMIPFEVLTSPWEALLLPF